MIKYYKENQYGNERNIIQDEVIADAFFSLTGRKTLKEEDIFILEMFGVTFLEVKK